MQPIKSTSFTIPGTWKSYTLDIHIDESPDNPWTDWDFEPPLMFTSCDRYHKSVTHYGTESIISELLDLITDRRLVLDRKSILESIELEEEYIREKQENYNQSFADALRDELRNYSDSLNLIEELARVAKVPYSRHDSRGYSQGDYADVLIILTPSWYQKTGANPKHSADTLKHTRELFDAWVWWDVYGFVLTEHKPLYNPDGTLSEVTDNEQIDSCWWFYGDDFRNNGLHDNLPDFARPYLDALI